MNRDHNEQSPRSAEQRTPRMLTEDEMRSAQGGFNPQPDPPESASLGSSTQPNPFQAVAIPRRRL